MNPWPFVVSAYAIFFLGLAFDALSPWIARRRAIAQLQGRWRRESTREQGRTTHKDSV